MSVFAILCSPMIMPIFEGYSQQFFLPLSFPSKIKFTTPSAHATTEALFSKEGVLNLLNERLDDVGLLFGGTEDQSLHHDTARQSTCWLIERPRVGSEENSSGASVSGWEVDRVLYNRAMASSHAPSSIIVGLGDAKDVLLGVQRNQIERIE